jgi:leucyl aminopeptidase
VLAHLTSDKGEAIPITPVTRDGFAAWLVGAAESDRTWLKATCVAAEPGRLGLLPGPGGRLARILVGVAPDDPLWSLAALPDSLPEGRYVLDAASWDAATTTKAVLGWALGTYAFTRYKSRSRGFATLVWPERADRAEIERLALGIFLARDLINTPAEDMGPAELAAAAKGLAERTGAACSVIVGDDRSSATTSWR